jgi:hypothetical protein
MADLVYTIKTPAELSGAEQAARALEVNIGKAKVLGKDFSALEAKLQTVKASIDAYKSSVTESAAPTAQAANDAERYAKALEEMDRAAHEAKATEAQRQIDLRNTTQSTGDAAAETQAAAEKLKLFSGAGENVKQVLNQITAQSPLLGTALRAIITPVGATLTLASVLFRSFQKDIAETNARLDEMASRAATPLANFAANFKAAQNEARAANREFLLGLDQLAEKSNAIAAGADAALASIQRLTQAQLELNNAAQAKAVAEVNLAESRGQLTGPQAIDARRQINEFYAQQARATQAEAEAKSLQIGAAELARKEAELSRVAGLAGPGEADVNRQARLKTLREEETNAKAAADALREKDLAAAKAAQAEADAKVESQRNLNIAGIPIAGADSSPRFRALERKAQEAADEVRRIEQEIKLNEQVAGRAGNRAVGIEGQIAAENAARAEAERLRLALEDERRKFQELQRTVELNRSVRDQTGALGSETAEIEATRQKEEMQRKAAEAAAREAERAARQPGQTNTGTGAGSQAAAELPPLAQDFAEYHNANVALLQQLHQQIQDAKSQLTDTQLS